MAEYIGREVAFDAITDLAGKAPTRSAYEAVWKSARVLKKIPTADVAPVVHGMWEREPSSYWRWTPSGAVAVTRTTYRCGLCGRGTAVKSNYCPNCGAKMEQEAR